MTPRDARDKLIEGVAHFNATECWEAHESWEALWLDFQFTLSAAKRHWRRSDIGHLIAAPPMHPRDPRDKLIEGVAHFDATEFWEATLSLHDALPIFQFTLSAATRHWRRSDDR